MRTHIAAGLSVFLALSACATPEVDHTAAAFDDAAFTTDLTLCRGGTFIVASARTIGVTLLGSAYGALDGINRGAHDGKTAEAAAIGAIIGGTIGLTAGAFQAVERHRAEVAACLAEKGYFVAG